MTVTSTQKLDIGRPYRLLVTVLQWVPLAMNAVLLVLSVVELTVAIWSSIIGCTICGGLIRSDFVVSILSRPTHSQHILIKWRVK